MTSSHKDIPRFASIPEMPSPEYDYRSSDCRNHANRYAARKLRNPPADAEVEERAWQCVGCLIGAAPSHLSVSADPADAAFAEPARKPALAVRTYREVIANAGVPVWLACVVGRYGLTEGRLYLAAEIHHEENGGRVILADDHGVKANCNLSRFVRVLNDGALLAAGWNQFVDPKGATVDWRHDKHGSVRLVCAKDGPRSGVGKFSIIGTNILVDGHAEALAQSAALSAMPVIAEPLRQHLIDEEDSAAMPHETAPVNASGRIPAETNNTVGVP
jgi:hypothetical protein